MLLPKQYLHDSRQNKLTKFVYHAETGKVTRLFPQTPTEPKPARKLGAASKKHCFACNALVPLRVMTRLYNRFDEHFRLCDGCTISRTCAKCDAVCPHNPGKCPTGSLSQAMQWLGIVHLCTILPSVN